MVSGQKFEPRTSRLQSRFMPNGTPHPEYLNLLYMRRGFPVFLPLAPSSGACRSYTTSSNTRTTEGTCYQVDLSLRVSLSSSKGVIALQCHSLNFNIGHRAWYWHRMNKNFSSCFLFVRIISGRFFCPPAVRFCAELFLLFREAMRCSYWSHRKGFPWMDPLLNSLKLLHFPLQCTSPILPSKLHAILFTWMLVTVTTGRVVLHSSPPSIPALLLFHPTLLRPLAGLLVLQ
jgi:hypothetical protein